MRAILPIRKATSSKTISFANTSSDKIEAALARLQELTLQSEHLVAGSVGKFVIGSSEHSIPRFVFMGPTGGGDTIRVGIFAGLHGDQPETTQAAIEFLRQLEAEPQWVRGVHIYIYPVCNPTGFEDGTAAARSGHDLTKEFWRGSAAPEIYYLEREMGALQLHGVIGLSSGKQSDFQLGVQSEILSEPFAHVAKNVVENLSVTTVPIPGAPQLTASEELKPVPFEVQLEIPRTAPQSVQLKTTSAILNSILESYSSILAIRSNI